MCVAGFLTDFRFTALYSFSVDQVAFVTQVIAISLISLVTCSIPLQEDPNLGGYLLLPVLVHLQ